MPLLPFLAPDDPFPPSREALSYPNGLLAVSEDLSPGRLLAAYRRGIFPWFEEPQPVLWWTPDPRLVLFPSEFHCARSLRRTLRRQRFQLSVNRCFREVMTACAAPRPHQDGTWISPRMETAYAALHDAGYAHSIEAWDREGRLAGGLYGVCLGGAFFGESMFSRSPDASKVALAGLAHLLCEGGGRVIDCQVETEHLLSLGARLIPRVDFEAMLAQTVTDEMAAGAWRLPEDTGALA
ncbi:leucyl/phenylalanyl-tRNA--protein transferase [Pseudohaliea rubra]|uniref:Leucyl/phenylalanyl-tRNA--protein transferase n=1 Tax=Pseudohaliea rubra DSM 19751 TaxID=1265313 RepID=A0A095VQY9_9GAMM|nr:leucyl/phenylalanyl-tRNA--protein transferase [Pseudohaliea rubra]KGE03513.1 Leucyl/phenylalanyl-tRNA--protein transferase [Pseudohaliea rubra DSM 19751]